MTELRSTICAHVERELRFIEDKENIKILGNGLADWVIDVVKKYRAGAIEHADGSLFDLDLTRERRQEAIDDFVYGLFEQVQYKRMIRHLKRQIRTLKQPK